MPTLFMICHGYPFRDWWFKWKHRHETSEEREARIAGNKRRFLEIYEEHMKQFESWPDGKELREWRARMEDIFGKTLRE